METITNNLRHFIQRVICKVSNYVSKLTHYIRFSQLQLTEHRLRLFIAMRAWSSTVACTPIYDKQENYFQE